MTLITNKRATFDYELLDTYEAGVSLLGTEVKSIRRGQGKLEGAHVIVRGGEAFLVGASVPAFQEANAPHSYDPTRARKLLLTEKELKELETKSEKQGLTIVPLKWHNHGSKLKLQIAIARGKKKQDKRESLKKRESNRNIERLLKQDSRV